MEFDLNLLQLDEQEVVQGRSINSGLKRIIYAREVRKKWKFSAVEQESEIQINSLESTAVNKAI